MKGKVCLYVILILILAVFAVYLWKSIEIRSIKKEMDKERLNLTEKSQKILDYQTKDLLRLLGISLSWVVQKEMIIENYGIIDDYFVNLIREPNFRWIILAKSDGRIVVSTDKSLEGKDVFLLIPKEITELSTIRVEEVEKGNIRVIAPIMHLNQKIGIIGILYSKEKVNFEKII